MTSYRFVYDACSLCETKANVVEEKVWFNDHDPEEWVQLGEIEPENCTVCSKLSSEQLTVLKLIVQNIEKKFVRVEERIKKLKII